MNSSKSSYDNSLSESDTAQEVPFAPAAEPSVADVAPTETSPPSSPAGAHSGLPEGKKSAKPAPARARRSAAAGWALLFSLAALAASGYALWQAYEWRSRNEGSSESIIKRLNDAEAGVAEARVDAKDIHGKLAELEIRTKQVEAWERLYQQRFAQSQEDHVIAEVRQAVVIAGQQLQYAGNVELALIALRGAQTRLDQSGHGRFDDLRRALAKDIGILLEEGTLDVPGTAERFERLLEKVDGLPLAYSADAPAEVPADAPAEAQAAAPAAGTAEEGNGVARFLRELGHGILAELRSQVKFERFDGKVEPALLTPDQGYFLRENLKTRLLAARLAMLSRDERTYAADLSQARNWIERFFDRNSREVQDALDRLGGLEAVRVGARRFALTESLAAVSRYEALHGIRVPQAASPPLNGRRGEPSPVQP